ncbi:NOP5/NOP56 family protein [Candidatus Undinarchaeota archaeon]
MNLEEIRQKAFDDARKGLKKSFAKKDAQIIQAISALDEIDKDVNVFSERLREWYSLHFPEMDSAIKDHKKYAEFAFCGNRDDIDDKRMSNLAKKSVGAELTDVDYKIMKRYAGQILEIYKLRDEIEKYVDKSMVNLAPNISELAGPTVGARLIKLAGSLENMARMPASTIQLLGAEKALFRHLKSGSKPPKYGVIFQTKDIHDSPKERRGRIARSLAAKLALAARIDYSNPVLNKELIEKYRKRVNHIK